MNYLYAQPAWKRVLKLILLWAGYALIGLAAGAVSSAASMLFNKNRRGIARSNRY